MLSILTLDITWIFMIDAIYLFSSYICFWKFSKVFCIPLENPWSDLDARYGVYAIINFVSESAGGHDLWVLGGVTHQNCALNHLKKRTSHGSSPSTIIYIRATSPIPQGLFSENKAPPPQIDFFCNVLLI